MLLLLCVFYHNHLNKSTVLVLTIAIGTVNSFFLGPVAFKLAKDIIRALANVNAMGFEELKNSWCALVRTCVVVRANRVYFFKF